MMLESLSDPATETDNKNSYKSESALNCTIDGGNVPLNWLSLKYLQGMRLNVG